MTIYFYKCEVVRLETHKYFYYARIYSLKMTIIQKLNIIFLDILLNGCYFNLI